VGGGEGQGVSLGLVRVSGQGKGTRLRGCVEGVVQLVLLADLHADVDGVRREHEEHECHQGGDDRDHPELVALAAQPQILPHHSTLISVVWVSLMTSPMTELMNGVIRVCLYSTLMIAVEPEIASVS
jgi:hypothetical protein